MNDLESVGVFAGLVVGTVKRTYWRSEELPTKKLKKRIAGKLKMEEFIPKDSRPTEQKLRKIYYYDSAGRIKATITDSVNILENDLKEIKNG